MKTRKKKTWLRVLLLIAILVPLGVIGSFYVRDQLAVSRIPPLTREDISFLEPLGVTLQPETELGQALYQAQQDIWQWDTVGEADYQGGPRDRTAAQKLRVQVLDRERLAEGLGEEVQDLLTEQALAARRSDEVYGEDGAFRPELVYAAFDRLITARLNRAEDYAETQEAEICFDWLGEQWLPREDEGFQQLLAFRESLNQDPDSWLQAQYESVQARLEPVYKEYAPLEENALRGPAPTEAWFGETREAAEVAALLRSAPARHLLNGQETVWNEEIAFYPNSTIHYYLDDTILALVWQEVEANAVGTFSEVLLADGSQLRRKISGDELFSYAFETTSEFCRDANAVLAVGGDFYHHARECGICVYQRQICRFDPKTCDTCYITADGDMLFSYRNQFETQAEAERFIAENDVLFSVAFGPVLIDNGVDVTPDFYPWGEIDDTYARSALGLLGERHYLTMNINCSQPGTEHYYLATLRQAADAMIARGCVKAYTLDGGQTATTAFHGELINPVQFGKEKPISDVIYFATAVPEAG